ncbi:MAG: penicillin-binding transpeptidase domain-containing protein [Patescibacteria group bacterium]
MPKPNLNIEEILGDYTKEEDLLEVPLRDRVFSAFFVVAGVITLVVALQIGNLGIVQHGWYEKRALTNMSDVKITPSPRGVIEDRFGKPLVKNESSVNIFLAARRLPHDSGERSRIISETSRLLGLNETDVFLSLETTDWNIRDRILLASDVTQDALVALSEASFPGIEIEPAFRRAHVTPLAFAHVLGYAGLVSEKDLRDDSSLVPDDVIGRDGLEAFYDSLLRGKNGRDVAYTSARGEVKEERVTESPQSGATLKTFIDKDFQEYFYERLTEGLKSLGRTTGTGIALNPQNGEVLALFGIPSFKPEKIKDYLSMPTEPLFNRAISGLYNPGSTIKPLVGIAALTEGVIGATKQIYSAGYIDLPNPYHPETPTRFVDWKPHGWVDMRSAIARSSNVYFYEVGGGFEEQKGLGISRLNAWWNKFGIGEKTGIDLIGEESGFLPTPEWKEKKTGEPWRLGDTYHVSIGQGDVTITPIELLNYIAAVANGGILYKPRVMESVNDIEGKELERSNPIVLKDLSGEIKNFIGEIQRGMQDGVEKPYGTSYLLHGLPFSVAAKTGTAQVYLNERTNAFFVGYAPAVNPKIAILVLIENSREGSHNTIPVARDVLLWYYENRLKGAR